MNTVQRAIKAGRAVEMGMAYVYETNHETSLDMFCAEVEQAGGDVISIEEYYITSPKRTAGTARRILRAIVIIPCQH